MSHKSTQTAFQEIKEKKALYKQRWVEGNSITHTSVTNPFLSVCWFYISGFVLNSQAQYVYGVHAEEIEPGRPLHVLYIFPNSTHFAIFKYAYFPPKSVQEMLIFSF